MSKSSRKMINADFGDSDYPIIIGRGVIDDVVPYVEEKTNNKKAIIVADSYFKESLAEKIKLRFEEAGFSVFTFYMDGGKGNKSINEVLKIFDILEQNDLARDSTLIAIGGGVVGDLAGFVASTWLRGMNLVHIPTTLMSMVDSSVGGKVAINFRKTINAIGNYYHPILTLMDINLIDSLSDRDYRSGIAEVIKCGIISDFEFYSYLNENSQEILQRSEQHVIKFLVRGIEIKINHVKGDVREGGKRLLLNYGHTLGHSVEISTEKNNHEQLRHGEGVSIGIMAVAYIAKNYLDLDNNAYESFNSMFKKYGLPTCVKSSELGFDRDSLVSDCVRNVKKDKKRLDNKIRLILADKIGHAAVYNDVPFSMIENAFDSIIEK